MRVNYLWTHHYDTRAPMTARGLLPKGRAS